MFFLPALMIALTAVGIEQQHRAQQKQEKASQAQNRIQERRSAREKLDQLRQARIQYALQANAGAGKGLGAGTSGFEGQMSSLSAQYGANASFIDSNMADAREAMINENAAATRMTNSSIYSGMASMAGSAFEAKGGWKSVFPNAGLGTGIDPQVPSYSAPSSPSIFNLKFTD